jgi:hypothetical protein
MDDIVIAALKKWPHVPAVCGWLGLDARGDWYLRDAAAQAAGAFASGPAMAKGSRIEHAQLRAFIERNYEVDPASGAWFFQNGPQRVFVELELAPWILGLQRQGDAVVVTTHTGRAFGAPHEVLCDEAGRLYLAGPLGLGLVRSTDMAVAADAVESQAWVPQDVEAATLPARFGFCLSPLASLPATAGGKAP